MVFFYCKYKHTGEVSEYEYMGMDKILAWRRKIKTLYNNQNDTIKTKYYIDYCIFFVYNHLERGECMDTQTNMIIYSIRLFVTNLYVYFGFIKISNSKDNNMKNHLLVFIADLVVTFVSVFTNYNVDVFLSILILVLLYGVLLGAIIKVKIGYAIIVNMISYAICITCLVISTLLSYISHQIALNMLNIENRYLDLLIILTVQAMLIYGFFKIKRFKNGFNFLSQKLNNDVADIIVTNISTIILLIYCLIGSLMEANYDALTRNLVVSFIIISITMIITIQKTLTMYYKQKLLKETMNDYERELKEKDQEIERLKAEKFNISKITHEFYNRQKALEMSVKDNLSNMETAEELGALDRIQDLTKEYSQKLEAMKSLPTLSLTEIPEIDDMFKYMQTECNKNNIEFRLKIVGDIFYLINHIIPKNKLETMIGDHIRDAIIAINSSKTTNKEIFVILGIKDKKYELCIYDTGIEFEIDTLLKLGLEQITTHKDTGGSGIGFLTTFETLKETKASLIIKELSSLEENHYTKAVIIRFDNKHQYKIYSYRAKEIKEKNKDRKIIIEDIASTR